MIITGVHSIFFSLTRLGSCFSHQGQGQAMSSLLKDLLGVKSCLSRAPALSRARSPLVFLNKQIISHLSC